MQCRESPYDSILLFSLVQWKEYISEKQQQQPSKRNDSHLWGSKDPKSRWKIECIVRYYFPEFQTLTLLHYIVCYNNKKRLTPTDFYNDRDISQQDLSSLGCTTTRYDLLLLYFFSSFSMFLNEQNYDPNPKKYFVYV